MSQTTFLVIAALFPIVFGLVMMLAPGKMLSNSLVNPPSREVLSVTQ